MKSDKYTRSAKGQDCQVIIPGVCNHNPETVVLAHLNGAGMGTKHLSIHGAYACSACHAWLDGGYAGDRDRNTRDYWHLEAVIKTQIIMVKDGVLKL